MLLELLKLGVYRIFAHTCLGAYCRKKSHIKDLGLKTWPFPKMRATYIKEHIRVHLGPHWGPLSFGKLPLRTFNLHNTLLSATIAAAFENNTATAAATATATATAAAADNNNKNSTTTTTTTTTTATTTYNYIIIEIIIIIIIISSIIITIIIIIITIINYMCTRPRKS